jgi:hypothetical protein
VKVDGNMDGRMMVPERFLSLSRFSGIRNVFLRLKWLMIGKGELLYINEEGLDNESVINRIKNSSRLVFTSLYEISQEQSEKGAEYCAEAAKEADCGKCSWSGRGRL